MSLDQVGVNRGWVFSSLNGMVSSRRIKERDIGVTRIYLGTMLNAGRYEILVPLLISRKLAGDRKINSTCENNSPLAFVGMLGNICILREMHEEHLMAIRLRDTSGQSRNGDISDGEAENWFWKSLTHNKHAFSAEHTYSALLSGGCR